MATVVQGQGALRVELPGKRYDRIFFSTMVFLLFVSVAIGFSHTYYLAGVFHAPLPSRIVHIHGAVFSLWMILLVVQTTLVSAKKVAIHRKLGIAGFVLVCIMFVMSLLVVANMLSRAPRAPNPDLVVALSVVPFSNAIELGILAAFAFALRRNAAAHKRLILIATIGMVAAAFARFHVPFLFNQVQNAYYCSYSLMAILMLYDLFALHRIHRATFWASLVVIGGDQLGLLLGPTALWSGFAHWIQSLGV